MTTSITNNAAIGSSVATAPKFGFASLGEKDFLRMLTAELQQQDPTAPVDQKQMLAQMAQFSSLAGINATNVTLTAIADKLDTLIAAEKAGASTITTQGA